MRYRRHEARAADRLQRTACAHCTLRPDNTAVQRSARVCRSLLTTATLLLCALFAAGSALAQPEALRDLRLQDHRAHAVVPSSLQGRALLLNFVFTGCSTTCSTQVRELAALRRSLPVDVRDALQLLSVTVDPTHDTPQTLAAYARLHEAEAPGWRFVTGDPPQIETLIARMAASDPRKLPRNPEDHRTSIWLFDAHGALVQRYAGVPVDRVRLAEEVTTLVRQKKK